MRTIELCTTRLRTFVAYFAVVASAASVRAAAAQAVSTITAGTRIRVTAPGALSPAAQSGRLLSLRPDSLVLQPDGSASSLVVPHASITELDVSDGRHTRTGRGLAIGLLVGAGAGAGIGAATYTAPHCANGNFAQCLGESIADAGGRGGRALVCGLLGGISGTVVGGLIGHAHSTERWRRLDGPVASLFRFLPNHMSVAPSGSRVAVKLRI
jgi:hypothetical protein